MWGQLNVFCPICGKPFRVNEPPPSQHWHSKKFGHVCSKECYNASELKYACMILGKDDAFDLTRTSVLVPGTTYLVKATRDTTDSEREEIARIAAAIGVTFVMVPKDYDCDATKLTYMYAPEACTQQPTLMPDGSVHCFGCGIHHASPSLPSMDVVKQD